jgi:hypothetical protein
MARAVAEHTRAADTRRVRLKWAIGTPYVVQGSSNLADVPILYFIKFGLGMGDAGGQLFNSLRNIGWFVKPLWGLLSVTHGMTGLRSTRSVRLFTLPAGRGGCGGRRCCKDCDG